MNPAAIFEDFERKYQGSYVQVQLDNKNPEFYQLRRIIKGANRFPQLELQSNKKGTILLNYNTNARIIFKVPSARFIQVGKDVAYYTKSPQRQWKRGLNNGNCLITNPMSNTTVIRGVTEGLNWTTIDAIFNTNYRTLTEALHMISKEGYQGVALSKNTAIVSHNMYKEYLLFYRFCIIGTVNKVTGEITTELFEKEINDEIK